MGSSEMDFEKKIQNLNYKNPMLLDYAFNAKRIAIIGVSSNRERWSNILFRRILKGPFRGEVIPVNPAHNEIEGQMCFPSILEIPGDIDYVQVLVPKSFTANAIKECVKKNVPVVHVLASGFGEVASGKQLQGELLHELEQGRTVMLGPNSLGLYSPRTGLDFSEGSRFEPGYITFISQSGALCTDVLSLGEAEGLRFSKILSVGNCAHLDWPDYVRYCRSDAETGIAVFYIESVTDGRALFDELCLLASVKPVLLLKGGRTKAGAKSVMSHTGRMTGEYHVWKGMMRQAGVVELAGLEDMLLTLKAWEVLKVRKISGKLMVVGCGGGVSVLISDALETESIDLAQLSKKTLNTLHDLIPDADEMGDIGNPLEMPVDRMFSDVTKLKKIIKTLSNDKGVGSLLFHFNLIAFANQFGTNNLDHLDLVCNTLISTAKDIKIPLLLLIRNSNVQDLTEVIGRRARKKLNNGDNITLLNDLGSALNLIRRFPEFSRTHKWKS